MNQTPKEIHKAKAYQIISSMTLDDLYVAIGRYCGPNNVLLSIRKYGIVLLREDIEDEIMQRLLLEDQ